MSIFSKIFRVSNLERSRFQIVLWWELRRVLYNIFLILVILCSLYIMGLDFLEIEMGTGEYFIFLIIIGLALALNLLYTFGWVLELFRKRNLTFAPKLFKYIFFLSFILYACLISIYKLI